MGKKSQVDKTFEVLDVQSEFNPIRNNDGADYLLQFEVSDGKNDYTVEAVATFLFNPPQKGGEMDASWKAFYSYLDVKINSVIPVSGLKEVNAIKKAISSYLFKNIEQYEEKINDLFL